MRNKDRGASLRPRWAPQPAPLPKALVRPRVGFFRRGAFPRPVRAVLSTGVIKIAISAEAYQVIAESLAFGIVAVEPERTPDGRIAIWLAPIVLAKLKMLRRPSESYSDVILALAGR